MKKFFAIILAVVMTASLAIFAFADSINYNDCTPAGTTAVVKRADPSVVVKDGVIDVDGGEYERLDIPVDEEDSFLHMCFYTTGAFEDAEALMATMEYYASWCDGQINIAVRCRPNHLNQVLDVNKDPEKSPYPMDDFCKNTAFTISSDIKQERDRNHVCNFYFAVAKRTDTGEYLLGYYADEQHGNSDSYIPTAGEDFCINYPGDGYVILEWSIPFSEIAENGTAVAGDSVYLSIGAESGPGETIESDVSYSVSLGDFTYLVSQKAATNHAAFELSDEQLGGSFENPFEDVAEGDYFFAPVMWAVKNNVTQGVKPTMFAPSKTCTREQVVTFLWRAKGSPEPTSSENPFKDVKEGDYFYKAVLWAVENEITQGISKTEFGTGKPCTRAQVVTFLWRTEGQPTPSSSENPFKDVKEGDYFYSAVLWAVGNNITQGVKPTKFAPGDACTRGQIVTFLYRDFVSA